MSKYSEYHYAFTSTVAHLRKINVDMGFRKVLISGNGWKKFMEKFLKLDPVNLKKVGQPLVRWR